MEPNEVYVGRLAVPEAASAFTEQSIHPKEIALKRVSLSRARVGFGSFSPSEG